MGLHRRAGQHAILAFPSQNGATHVVGWPGSVEGRICFRVGVHARPIRSLIGHDCGTPLIRCIQVPEATLADGVPLRYLHSVEAAATHSRCHSTARHTGVQADARTTRESGPDPPHSKDRCSCPVGAPLRGVLAGSCSRVLHRIRTPRLYECRSRRICRRCTEAIRTELAHQGSAKDGLYSRSADLLAPVNDECVWEELCPSISSLDYPMLPKSVTHSLSK